MNAIGAETFHGQHRGTGAGLQFTCNRFATVVVCAFQFICFLKLGDDENCFRALLLRYTRI
jgi:hypothetical protein